MPFRKAVIRAQLIVGQPPKSQLTGINSSGTPERLDSALIEVERVRFILLEVNRLLPELSDGLNKLLSKFNSDILEKQSDDFVFGASREILGTLSSAGSDFKLLGIVVAAAKKNFASVDSLPFDTFGKNLTAQEWSTLQLDNIELKRRFSKRKEELASKEYLEATSPLQAKKDLRDLKRDISQNITPLLFISSLKFEDVPSRVAMEYTNSVLTMSDTKKKVLLKKDILSEVKFQLLVHYRQCIKDGVPFKLDVNDHDLELDVVGFAQKLS